MDLAILTSLGMRKKRILVPSNHAISLKVLDRVSDSLTKRGVLNIYTEAFLEQEREGISERISLPLLNYMAIIFGSLTAL